MSTTTAQNQADLWLDAQINPKHLASSFDPVSELVDECKINLTDDGMAITAVDPANVGMVDVVIPAALFSEYTFEDGVTLGVNLDRFVEALKQMKGAETMQLRVDEETRKLTMEGAGLSIRMSLIDPESIRREPDIPELELDTTVVMETQSLKRGVKAADMISDYITFTASATDGTFVVSADGDTDDVSLTFDESELVDASLSDAEAVFSLDYVKGMVRTLPKKGETELEFGQEFPIKMHFDIPFEIDDETVTTSGLFVVAPRIQSD